MCLRDRIPRAGRVSRRWFAGAGLFMYVERRLEGRKWIWHLHLHLHLHRVMACVSDRMDKELLS